jgi:hypothetical protein
MTRVKIVLFSVAVLAVANAAAAQDTANGTLSVTATVQSSIGLTFENDAAGIALTGAGTTTATMAFGAVSAFGTLATSGVTRTVGASDFTVSSPFGVRVLKANSTSSNYSLTAALGSADATNTWRVNAVALSTTPASLGSSYSYSSTIAHTLHLVVPMSATAGPVSRVVNFTATAN